MRRGLCAQEDREQGAARRQQDACDLRGHGLHGLHPLQGVPERRAGRGQGDPGPQGRHPRARARRLPVGQLLQGDRPDGGRRAADALDAAPGRGRGQARGAAPAHADEQHGRRDLGRRAHQARGGVGARGHRHHGPRRGPGLPRGV